uniref:Uncharacterized protein n=1 Tax=Arundo donax TaxID=35708 RepID=A0A0A8ZV99_ARUDO
MRLSLKPLRYPALGEYGAVFVDGGPSPFVAPT